MRIPHLPTPPRGVRQQTGLGLVDVLIALLLLSMSLLGAGAATLHAMQAGRSATLQMRAADLIADLQEDLESAGDIDAALPIAAWKQRVVATLPAAAATIVTTGDSSETAVLTARLQWQEPAAATLELSMPLPRKSGQPDP